jgi:Fe-S-cluster-containing dehydrogenase component
VQLRDYFLNACPYKVSRYDDVNDKFVKCDMCFDRQGGPYVTFRDGKPTTACELTCPVGAIVTDGKGPIMAAAKERLREIKTQYPKASLWGARGRVVFLLTENPANYKMTIGASDYKLGNYGLVSA